MDATYQSLSLSVSVYVILDLSPTNYQYHVQYCTLQGMCTPKQTKGAEQRDDLLVDAPQRRHRRPRQTTKQYAEEDCSREGRLGLRLG